MRKPTSCILGMQPRDSQMLCSLKFSAIQITIKMDTRLIRLFVLMRKVLSFLMVTVFLLI